MSISKNALIALVAGLVVVGVVVAALLVATKNDDAPDDAHATPSTTVSGRVEPTDGQTYADANGLSPHASIDGDQRSWPSSDGSDIDSQYATPGAHSVEPMFNRAVYTPINPLGDLPAKNDLGSAMQCEAAQLPGNMQLQYVKARFLVVNDKAGPSTMVRAIPRGYAHTAAGAVTAAINQMAYGMYGQDDEVGQEANTQLWSTSREAQKVINGQMPHLSTGRVPLVPGATAFKLLQCSENSVMVELVFGDPDGRYADSAVAIRVPMMWRDKDWHADFSGSIETVNDNLPAPTSLEGYTALEYS